jgi:hypothetical protein
VYGRTTKTKINPNEIRTRDYLMLELIRGATKAGVQVDRKKEQSKHRCRQKQGRWSEE